MSGFWFFGLEVMVVRVERLAGASEGVDAGVVPALR